MHRRRKQGWLAPPPPPNFTHCLHNELHCSIVDRGIVPQGNHIYFLLFKKKKCRPPSQNIFLRLCHVITKTYRCMQHALAQAWNTSTRIHVFNREGQGGRLAPPPLCSFKLGGIAILWIEVRLIYIIMFLSLYLNFERRCRPPPPPSRNIFLRLWSCRAYTSAPTKLPRYRAITETHSRCRV